MVAKENQMEMMDPDQYKDLRQLAMNNATLHALLDLLDHGVMELDEWYFHAIVMLTKSNDLLFKHAVEAENRAMPRSIVTAAAHVANPTWRYVTFRNWWSRRPKLRDFL